MLEFENRPDPDQLLARINQEEENSKRGKLKIFLGYVAGVGKTYAMLEAAHQRKEEGIDVVIGYVETHNRKETNALIAGLEVIPKNKIEYRGASFFEMDIDAVITRHPRLVLVDELAHTNAPGCRHLKRYQDVEELLAAGIDVYSTVNIQHLESLSDIVNQITGITVREKIPDRIVDEADEIELIDLPTDELLKRLRDGKVYISDQAMRALEKFFRKGNLTALRELSLRRAANRVDSQMLSYMKKESIVGPWRATDRILVCISSHPMGERLIRSGRNLADELNAEWYVIFVETPQHLRMPVENQIRVQGFLKLAEELGAKVALISGESVANTVTSFAREHNVTKIVAGKPRHPGILEALRGSVIDKIIDESGNIDLYIVSSEQDPSIRSRRLPSRLPKIDVMKYGLSFLLVIVSTLIGQPLRNFLEPTNMVMVYLLVVVISAIFLGRGPAIFSSLLGVLAFDFFFVKPVYTFTVNDTQYLITFVGLLIVGLIISNSAALLKSQVDALRKRDQQTQSLYALSKELTSALSIPQVTEIALRSTTEILDRQAIILTARNGNLEVNNTIGEYEIDEKELAVAEWVFKHNLPAGAGTDTLSSSRTRFVPLQTADRTVGVLGVKSPGMDSTFTHEQRMILDGIANLTALAVERAMLVEIATQNETLRQTEKLQTALLNTISHELRTPLSSILGVLSSLAESEKTHSKSSRMNPVIRQELIASAIDQTRQLNRLVENLLSMTRIEAGSVRLNLEPVDLQDLIGTVLQHFSSRLNKREINVEIPPDLPLVNCDPVLIAQVITNLLDNACKYTPPGSPITISILMEPDQVCVSVLDNGSGLDPEEIDKVFGKFFRGSKQKTSTGTGLGLSICKGIIEAHGGSIKVENDAARGAKFSFVLPHNLKIEHGK